MAEIKDWEYRCTSCAKVITAGADFNEPCPSCGGHGWICHWLNKPGAIRKSAGNVSQPSTSEPSALGQDVSGITLLPANLSQPVLTDQNNNGHKKPGPRPVQMDDLIKPLAARGLSSRGIAADLEARGFHISYKSIQRYFKRQKQGGLL